MRLRVDITRLIQRSNSYNATGLVPREMDIGVVRHDDFIHQHLECMSFLEQLTPRQQVVAVLRAEGHTNGEIARHVGVSLRTVNNEVKLIHGTMHLEV